jgi:tetratricopeptide (TPR) repeat protein/predicted aspartyl protease
MPMSRRHAGIVFSIAALCTLALGAQERLASGDADVQFQLANQLFEENRLQEALRAFDRATQTDDAGLATLARKGKIRTSLKVAEFGLARREAETLAGSPGADADALTLLGDALWANGLFDEADKAYERALVMAPAFPRARFGQAKSLATRSRLQEALDQALAASATSPRDGEMHAAIGDIYERLNRYDEAVVAYTNYINLLPNKDRSDKAAWARAQVEFLDAFKGSTPVEIDAEDLRTLHTLPFKLVKDKIVVQARVNGGRLQDFVLDTGSEETTLSRETAQRERVRPITYTLSAGVGEVGLRGLQLARVRLLELGTLQVRNLPVLIKNPALRGIPKREGESFSPMSLGLSMTIDYQQKLLTIGRHLPSTAATTKLPMRVSRLAMVRGVLNSNYPAYFVVDTGGEVISISSDTASALGPNSFRRIPLKVWGTSGWDRDAFLLPGNDLDFDRIEYRNFPLVVLNLRAPSLLLGFQLGGIVGHKFLSNYRVSMDLDQSELRLEKF